MKIIFAGSPEIAVPSLRAIHDQFTVVGVLTNPDAPAGRGKKIIKTPVRQLAEELGLEVFTPLTLRTEARNRIAELNADILAVVAYKKIFGPRFLSLFPEGGINLHPSLLPLYRGPSPLNQAIINCDDETGISIQRIALEMDAGPILHQESFPLTPDITAGMLSEKCAELGARAMVSVLKKIENGTVISREQDHTKATYTTVISKNDGHIDWTAEGTAILGRIKGYNPWPMAFTFYDGLRLNIIDADVYDCREQKTVPPGEVLGMDKKKGILIQTGSGIIGITRLQLQAKKAMDWRSFVNGNRGILESRLG